MHRSPDGIEAAVEFQKLINNVSLETAPVILCAHNIMIELVEEGTRKYRYADERYVGIAQAVDAQEVGSINLVW